MANQAATQPFRFISLNPQKSKQTISFLLAIGVILALGGGFAIGSTPYGLKIVLGYVAVLVAFMIVLRPEIGLYILVIFVFTNLSDVLTYSFGLPSTNKPLVGLILVGTLANRVVLRRKPLIFRLTEMLILAYGAVLLLSLIGSENQAETQSLLTDWLKDYAILMVIVQLAGDEKVWKRMQWALIFAAGFLAMLSSYQNLTRDFSNTFYGLANAPVHQITSGTDSQRVTGPLTDPNFYALILLMVLPMAAYQMLTQKNLRLRVVCTVVFLAILATIIFTYSRGAFMALVAIGALMVRDRRYNPYKIAALVFVLGAVLSPVIPPQFWERISTIADVLPSQGTDTQTEKSFRGRSSEAIVAVQMYRDYPILGVGYGNYQNKYLEYSSRLGLDARFQNRKAHSLYLEVIAETGTVGIVIFLSMVTVLYVSLIRAKRLAMEAQRPDISIWITGIQYGFVAYLLASIFLHGNYIRYFWLLVGFVASSSVMVEEVRRRYLDTKTTAASPVSVASE